MATLTGWKRYTDHCKKQGIEIDPGLARFAARYSLAISVDGVTFSGLSKSTSDGYSAALRVGMAYSALEAFEKAVGKGSKRVRVISVELARNLRTETLTRLRKLLLAELDSPKLRNAVESVFTSPSEIDVTSVVAGIRHLFFHGNLSAHGARLAQSAQAKKFLNDLANETLHTVVAAFVSHLDTHAIGVDAKELIKKCPSCKCASGEIHLAECEVGLCKSHGIRYSQCYEVGKHGRTIFRGVLPRTIEATRENWFVRSGERKYPDVNRIMTELEWNAESELYQHSR